MWSGPKFPYSNHVEKDWMTIRYHLELPSVKSTEKKAVRLLKSKINQSLIRAGEKIVPKLKKSVEKAIRSSPEYVSLISGKLRAEFGIPNGKERLDEIIRIWINSFKFQIGRATITSNNKIRASLTITAIDASWADVLSSPAAFLTTEKSDILEWLDWLLIKGDTTIILDYDVAFGSAFSRTGTGAFMLRKKGSRWRVPPEFSGTRKNNFATRSVRSIETEIKDIIMRAIR